MTTHRLSRRSRGFTLVELTITLGLALLLTLIAWPSLNGQLVKARRADATVALELLQQRQERYLAAHGLYAGTLAALGSAPTSPEGLYQLELRPHGTDTYLAVARARADGPQGNDGPCTEITLRVAQGFADLGPSASCWRR